MSTQTDFEAYKQQQQQKLKEYNQQKRDFKAYSQKQREEFEAYRAKLMADEVTALKVVLNDGYETVFVLPDKPVATLHCREYLWKYGQFTIIGFSPYGRRTSPVTAIYPIHRDGVSRSVTRNKLRRISPIHNL